MKKISKKVIVLISLCALIISVSVPVSASSTKKITIKKVSVKTTENKIKIKVKINNKYKKKELTYGEEFYVYKKENGKWEKIDWVDGYGFDDIENVINPKTKVTKVFTINKKYLSEEIVKGKTYKITFKLSGNKKNVKFKI